jgi:hypothetical protein
MTRGDGIQIKAKSKKGTVLVFQKIEPPPIYLALAMTA